MPAIDIHTNGLSQLNFDDGAEGREAPLPIFPANGRERGTDALDDAGETDILDAACRDAGAADSPEDKRLVVAPMTNPLPHTSQVV